MESRIPPPSSSTPSQPTPEEKSGQKSKDLEEGRSVSAGNINPHPDPSELPAPSSKEDGNTAETPKTVKMNKVSKDIKIITELSKPVDKSDLATI